MYPGVSVAAERDTLNFVSVVDVTTILHVRYVNLLSIEVSCHLFILEMFFFFFFAAIGWVSHKTTNFKSMFSMCEDIIRRYKSKSES